MKLHARQVALAAGASNGMVQRIADQLVAEGNVRVVRAREIVAELEINNELIPA
jgi:hydroxymethylglutaryl-CoA reductase